MAEYAHEYWVHRAVSLATILALSEVSDQRLHALIADVHPS